MGQALYRKYRSKSLDEVVGQEHITTALKNALKQGRISHAYLFTGPRGVGKTSVARILAYAVNDLPYEDRATHLDIIEIDAASNRRIDEIRELRDKVHVAPTSAKYKVYIIDEVHMLTREAFNALLKTLEEPPEHAIFILATTEAHKLPETIVSRTQRFAFKPIEASQAVEHLKSIAKAEKISIDDAALKLIAEHGNGSFRDSISLLDQIRNIGEKVTAGDVLEMLGDAPDEMIDSLVKALVSQSASELVNVLQGMYEQGFEPARIAKQLGTELREQIIAGSPPLPSDQTLKLMSDLVNVPASADQAVALEIALLERIAMPTPTFVKTKEPAIEKPKAKRAEPDTEQTPKSTVQKTQESNIEGPIEPATETEPTEKPEKIVANSAELDDELWHQVVEAIKEKHNTLYGVIRMAQPTWEDTTLTLSFAFAFHQKRINDSKHREVIAQTIKDLSGQEVNIVCVLDPSAKPEMPVQEDMHSSSDNSTVKNISNIFGGAELLES